MNKFNKFTFSKIERIIFDSIDSTQIYARKNYRKLLEKDNKWYSIISNKQTNGIGQHERKWVSPQDVNLYFTLIIPAINGLNNREQCNNLKLLSMYTSYSICNSLNKLSLYLEPRIKWVNDILINDKKIAGVLIESYIEGKNMTMLIGVGLNVNMDKEDFDSIIGRSVTSLKAELNHALDKNEVYVTIENDLYENITKLLDGKIDATQMIMDIANYLAFLNKKVSLLDKDGINTLTTGEFVGIDENGYCLLKENSHIKAYSDGKLVLL